MTKLSPAPIYEKLVGDDAKATLPWVLFFNQVFTGDTGQVWTPTFTNLTQVGTPTITGKLYQLGKLAYFSVRVIPGTSTTSTAGTTYINNFPLTLQADGACLVVSGLLGGSSGMCDSASNRIYVPAWTAVTVPLTVVGLVEAL